MAGKAGVVTAPWPPGWAPGRVYQSPAGLMVDWCHVGGQRFTDPFFEQTMGRALWNPAQMLFRRQTPIGELETLAGTRPGLTPTAFIFHLSRCGSTLVSQMLAAVPRNIVIAEAPPLDRVLMASLYDPSITRSQQIGWLRGLVHALGEPRTGETELFIKWDSWHILQWPLIAEAFPAVPWIFLYREPAEVMVSHVRMRGTQMVPGLIDPRVFGVAASELPDMTLDEYGARVLAALCEAALVYSRRGNGRLVNFSELPDAVLGRLAPLFARDATEPERVAMLQATRRNAKDPSQAFAPDAAGKQREATAEIHRLANQWLAGPYARLEAARLAQASG